MGKEKLLLPAKKLGLPLMPDYCPRCHYAILHMRGPFPFAPFPSIFASIDQFTKDVFQSALDAGVSIPGIACFGKLKQGLPAPTHHTFAIEVGSDVILRGSPDAIFRRTDDRLVIGDFKCARAKGEDDPLYPVYRAQLGAYRYIMERLESETVEKLGLIYTEPVTELTAKESTGCITAKGFHLPFAINVHEVSPLSASEIESLAATARDVYDQPTCPERRAGCYNCAQVDKVINLVMPTIYQGASASLRSTPEYEMTLAVTRLGSYARMCGCR